MRRFNLLGGFFSLVIVACLFLVTPVLAGPADIINRFFGRENNQNNNGQGAFTVENIQQNRYYQNECYLEICAEEPLNRDHLRVCREWADQTFGRNDCAYVNAAVNAEYRCIDEYRCLPNPNQTQLSRDVQSACDEVLEQKYHTTQCSLLRPSLVSNLFANLVEREKQEALNIQNPSARASSCVQTMCSHENGEAVRARDLRICRGWADLQLGTTSCSEMRRVVDDGSIQARSYRMSQEQEFTCVAALCGESFIEISPTDENFCQEWAQFNHGTNQCQALLNSYAPEDGRATSRREEYNAWVRNDGDLPENRNTQEWRAAENAFRIARDQNRLNACLPILLQQNQAQNNTPNNNSVSVCQYLAEQYGFYNNPTPVQLAQCRAMFIIPGEDSDIEKLRCQYWLAHGDQLQINENITPQQENAQVDTPELFFEDVSFADGVYTVTVGNSGFVPNAQLQPQLLAHWVPQGNGWGAQAENVTDLQLTVQPTGERRWVFRIPTNDLSRSFPPENAMYLEFVIDPRNRIVERNEANNAWAVAPRPDFRMADIENLDILRTGVLNIVIRNHAPRSVYEGAVPFYFQWLGSEGQTLSSFDTMAFMVERNQRYEAEVAVRQFPPTAVGFRITLNFNQRIPEMSYQNNTYEYFFAPDLVIDQVTTQKDSVVARVRNIGNMNGALVDFDLQATWMSEQGLPINSTVQAVRPEGDEQQWTVRFPLSSAPKNAASVRLTVDEENMVNETNESNNIADYALNQAGIVAIAQNRGKNVDQPSADPGILPGSVLYGVKEAWRSIRLGMTLNPNKKAQYMLDIAGKRENERLEAIRQGNALPENLPSPLPLDVFLTAVKNIPNAQADQKQEFLKKSIAHIEFEYMPHGTDAEPIVFEYEENPTGREAEPIVFEYMPKPEQMEQFSRNFLKIMNVADGELNKRQLLDTMSEKNFGSAQKHMQTALKLSAVAEQASEQIKPLLLSTQTQLMQKISESMKQEGPAQQKLLMDVIPVREETVRQTKTLVQTLAQEMKDETVRKTIFVPKLLQIEALEQNGSSSLPDTTGTTSLRTTTSSTVTPPTTECVDDNKVVCGADGKTYTNKCSALKAGVKVLLEGKCADISFPPLPPTIITKPTSTVITPPPVDCSKQGTRSVCGANGKTYTNACYAEKDGIKVAFQGACPVKSPTPAPECTSNAGCDDKNSCTENKCVEGKCVYTRYNACGTNEYSCTDGIDNDRNGRVDCADTACSSLSICAPKPTCDDNEPVCGRDGVTYTSECDAKAKGVIVDSFGRCPVTQTNTTLNTNTQTNNQITNTNTNTQTTNTNTQTTNTNNTITQPSQKKITIVNGSFSSQNFTMSSSQTLVIQNQDDKTYTFGGGTIQGTIAPKATRSISFPSIGQYNTYLHENASEVIMITVGE